MIGFIAEYAGGELIIDPVEIEDAGWYRFDQLPGLPSSGISIASRMIQHYTALCVQTYGHNHCSEKEPRDGKPT
jgi:NAD+ diphosphatase